MRNGQNKRMRGRNNNHRKNHNPMARVYESNGPGCENSRKPVAHRGKIHAARARRADLRRSDRGGKLLSACRALLPRDRGGAGAVPPEQPAFRPRPRTSRKARATTVSTTATTTGSPRAVAGDSTRTARASRSPTCRAMHNPFRSTAAAASRNVRSKAMQPTERRCRPAAVLHHRRATAAAAASSGPAAGTRTATTASPTVSRCIAGGGVIAARAPTCRAAVTAETSRPRASDRDASGCASEVTRRVAGPHCFAQCYRATDPSV